MAQGLAISEDVNNTKKASKLINLRGVRLSFVAQASLCSGVQLIADVRVIGNTNENTAHTRIGNKRPATYLSVRHNRK